MSGPSFKRILVVDDDHFMRITIKAILATVGRYVVEEAADGTAALVKLGEFRPDLVLCDIGMAPMGGIEFVETLRNQEDESLRDIPVVMLTAVATEGTIVTAGRLRISGYLLKPVSLKRVSALFRTLGF